MLNRAKTSTYTNIVAVMLVLMVFGVICPLKRASSSAPVTGVEHPQRDKAYTPLRGSAERKEILDTLRAELQRLHNIEAIFVVNYLKVQRGWAWIETLPQTPDGSSRYEDVSALLRKSSGRWRVVEIACAEEENPDCIGHEGFFGRLMKRFPAAPREILP